ncbi:hypothetical protein SAMN05444145_102198 [Alistipes timonensis JC136]|uniref:Uncharacterized protein n=1 Tax=Alistipes timonensis JC136 TaxID=1033731 RepID=A0A1H3ZGU3_9BACT|nr:hypothetical protein [Alistipes timonensis]SEA22524.1 hypothetical protein SAMN05444145_102198 [Alistipes timonensis JC136]
MEQQTNPEQGQALKNLLGAQEKPVSAVNPESSPYTTNSTAESVVDVLAVLILIGGIIGGIILIAQVVDTSYGGAILIGWGVALIVTAIIQWAFLKVLCNISRNLFNINHALRSKNK